MEHRYATCQPRQLPRILPQKKRIVTKKVAMTLTVLRFIKKVFRLGNRDSAYLSDVLDIAGSFEGKLSVA
jgi:hypothetical protein